jgi:hypothetical protein
LSQFLSSVRCSEVDAVPYDAIDDDDDLIVARATQWVGLSIVESWRLRAAPFGEVVTN